MEQAIVRVYLLFALCLAPQSVSLNAIASTQDKAEKVHFAFVGDPQIGYGDLWGDYFRFNRVVDAINRSAPDFVIIPGDLVEERSPLESWLFGRSNAKFRPTVLLAPGNHDIIDQTTLEDFRRRFGPDYYARNAGPVTLLVINSETAGSPAISEKEFNEQWDFITRSLNKSTAEGKQPILVMHRPPFARDEHEKERKSGWPPETRARLLALSRSHGVRLILAGHLHTTRNLRTSDGIEIRVLAGTARSFDHSPIGYEEFIFEGASYRTKFHAIGPPPHPLPPSMPGMRDWTPRLLDFSWSHWFFTVAFLLVGLSCRNAAKRSVRSHQLGSPRLWTNVSLLLFFFALNTQLDFDEFLRSSGRILAKATGVSSVRHVITGTGLMALVLLAGVSVIKKWRAGTARHEVIALAALAIPSAWFILSTISHHDIEMLFAEFYWDILILISLAIVFFVSQRGARTHGATTENAS